ncbi:MAG: Biosynthetic peptidoglycan transglycosylase [Syntrophus sp. SKADARSKE-3]|nr:Biosynthetic peptidoglycan transglycosylase [Syntrophus sp. SKADARSKE-3]
MMFNIIKKKSNKDLSAALRLLNPKFILLVILVLVGFSALTWFAERRINKELPTVIEYVQTTSGLRCEIERLSYIFPTGLSALNVRLSDDNGRQWLKATSITAGIRPFAYFNTKKAGLHLIRSLDAQNLEVTLHHKKTGGWEFPLIRQATGDHSSPARSDKMPINLQVGNLTVNVQTDKGTTSHSYRKMTAKIDRGKGYGSLEVIGDGERINLSVKKDSGEFNLETDSFGLAILSPFLGSSVPLADIFVTANVKGMMVKGAEDSFTISGNVESLSRRSSFLSPLKARENFLGFDVAGRKIDSRIFIQNGKISIGEQHLFVNGWCSNGSSPEVDLIFSFPDFSIGKAVSTLPRSFHSDLPDLKVEGKIMGKFYFYVDLEKAASLDYRFEGKYEPVKVLSLGSRVNINSRKSSFHHTVRTPKGKMITFLVGEGNPRYVPIKDIPQSLISAVCTAEDGGFFSHKGFNQRQIRNSIVENLEAGRIVRGASTISMQVAKNLFLSQERTFNRKLEEMFITMALEQHLSKERIMEIYLNIIEWGDGIYGIGQAANYYFNKTPQELKPVESAFLASIIARPRKNWKPDPLSKISDGWRKYLHLILAKMYEKGNADVNDMLDAGLSEERIGELAGGERLDEIEPLQPE